MRFRATPSRGGWVGLAALLVLLTLGAGLAWGLLSTPPGPRSVLLAALLLPTLAAATLVGYQLWGYLSLRYEVSRDGLLIRWAATSQVIPMPEIEQVLAGRPYEARLSGLRWPGQEVGRTLVVDNEGVARETLVYATTPPAEQILVVTRALSYAISPEDRDGFLQEVRARRRLGPQQAWEQHTEQAPWARLSLLGDTHALRWLALAVALNALAFGWLAWHYPELQDTLVLRFRFDPVLAVPVPGPESAKAVAWRLPFVGLAAIVLNGALAAAIHSRARVAALLLMAGATLVQVAIAILFTRIG